MRFRRGAGITSKVGQFAEAQRTNVAIRAPFQKNSAIPIKVRAGALSISFPVKCGRFSGKSGISGLRPPPSAKIGAALGPPLKDLAPCARSAKREIERKKGRRVKEREKKKKKKKKKNKEGRK